jgi:hypothetical protein
VGEASRFGGDGQHCARAAVFQLHCFLDGFSVCCLAKCLMELIENVPENRSVGGSTPPLGTISFDHLATTGGSQWRPGMESSRLRV